MARARARVELEEICDDAGELLTFEESKPQFGIRHALVFTTLSAIVIALFREGGMGPAFAGILVSILAWFVFYVYDRERKKENEIEQRLREFRKRHKQSSLQDLDVNVMWKLRNRRS